MKNSFFTPTHDENGRKLSKAERRAANKAKHAASKKSSKKAATKAELNPRKVEAVAEALDFSYIDACSRTYTPIPEYGNKPKQKAKRKSKRLSHNDKLEAQAQRLSRGTAGNEPALTKEPSAMATSIPSANMEIFDLCKGDPVAAARHASFMGLDAITMDDIL